MLRERQTHTKHLDSLIPPIVSVGSINFIFVFFSHNITLLYYLSTQEDQILYSDPLDVLTKILIQEVRLYS